MSVSSSAATPAPTPSLLDHVPAAGLVIVAVIGFQLSSVIAKPAIEDAGPLHTTFLRAGFGALMLLAWKRPNALPRGRSLWLVLATGLTVLWNSMLMYAAFERIPVGIAAAIVFWGPMALALHGSRRPIDYVWVILAITGILLFTPLADSSFDTTGVLLAVLAGAGFAATLVLASKLGKAIGAVPAAGMTTLVGAVLIAPISLGSGFHEHMETGFLGRMLLVAVLFSVFGVAIEYEALTRVRPSLYAILISLEPAVGAVLGFMILGETIGWLGAAGIGAVSVASIGASRTHQRGAT